MKLIDVNNNGYLSFTDFSTVFGPSMSTTLTKVDQKDIHLPNMQSN